MFGNNPKRPAVKGDGKELLVQSIFKTLQAEGPYAGVPAIFIRLGGCNLACSFCDTEFESFAAKTLEDIVTQIQSLSKNSEDTRSIFLVVITGGEPLRQPIGLLCEELFALGYKIQIETNGTLYQELPDRIEIVCSPKVTNGKYHNINEQLLPKITVFKFLISNNIPGYNNVPNLGQVLYNISVFVQAMDEYNEKLNAENKRLAVGLALERGYRLSYQMHKELGSE